jgi:DNA-binding NarL/FixJ family response regulator
LVQTINIQEDERRRIAADIHDRVVSRIVGALYEVETCAQLHQRSEGLNEQLQLLKQLLNEAVERTRTSIYNLWPATLDHMGLIPALRELLGRQEKRTGIRHSLHVYGSPYEFRPTARIAVYRIAQEALNNVRQYAAAGSVDITVRFSPKQVRVVIQDDGKGFDISSVMLMPPGRHARAAGSSWKFRSVKQEPERTESGTMNPMRVLIVDDHLVVRRGLCSMLADAKDVEIVGEASSAGEAIKRATSLRPDILVLDIRMPGMNGLRLLRCLKEQLPDIKVIILTNYDDEQFLLEAFRAGAYGYLLKNVSREDLLEVLHAAHQGKRMLSPELMDSVLKQFAELGQRQAMDQFGLSNREIELLGLVAEGATNRQIAERLYWSETTVKRKLSDVFQKLDVCDRAQAVAVAMRHGLL